MPDIDPLGADSDMLAAAKAYLRFEPGDDDPVLGEIIIAAVVHAEQHIGQMLIRRSVRETLSASSAWWSLGAVPVASIIGVTGIPAEGASFTLAPSAWEGTIDSRGKAHLRVLQPGISGRVEVRYLAGIADDWASLPESLRLAILRLAAHYHAHRDAVDGSGVPAAVAALLQPWRRMRLS